MALDAGHFLKGLRAMDHAAAFLAGMDAATQLPVLDDQWSFFLMSHNRACEQFCYAGEGTTGAPYRWQSELIRDRKADPILKYIWEARNADEHGRDAVTRMKGPAETLDLDTPGFPITTTPARVSAAPVRSKWRVEFTAPSVPDVPADKVLHHYARHGMGFLTRVSQFAIEKLGASPNRGR